MPTIGFIAHVDTSPEMSGADVDADRARRYDGRDLVLPDDPSAVLRLADNPALAEQLGHDIVTASGTTLLGADDKAGVAEIVTAAAFLVAHPEIPHGAVRIAFTPDEEIGRGTAHFDVARFGARCAYTMDGGSCGEIESESFSADAMTVTFHGFNTHPGYAKGRMVNAIKVAAAFIDRLPARSRCRRRRPTGTRASSIPTSSQAGVERTSVKLLVRDFDTARARRRRRRRSRRWREDAAARRSPARASRSRIEESYRNMKEVLDRHPEVVEYAARGDPPRRVSSVAVTPIRGGTDGSRLSFMGLPTPNLFAGEHNFHSRLEWVSVQDMEKAVEVIVHLCRVWEEPGQRRGVSSRGNDVPRKCIWGILVSSSKPQCPIERTSARLRRPH